MDRDKLITDNLPFVTHIAKQYLDKGLALDDLISEGTLGLVNAADHYDPTKGVNFISYAVWWIRQAIKQALAAQTNGMNVTVSKQGDTPLIDKLPGDGHTADQQTVIEALRQELRTAIDSLNQRERKVLSAFYGIGTPQATLAEIAAQMGIKRERARQIRNKAIRHLRSQSQSSALRTYLTHN